MITEPGTMEMGPGGRAEGAEQTSGGCSPRAKYEGLLFGAFGCAIVGSALIIVPAVSLFSTDHIGNCILVSIIASIFGMIFGLSCRTSCKGRNVLAAGIFLITAAVSQLVAMSIYTKGYGCTFTPVICGLGWVAVLISWLAAILKMCAYIMRRRIDQQH